MADKPVQSAIQARRDQARTQGGAAYGGRRAEILSAAATAFRRRGYKGTTLAHVAEEVGADRASIYYYFGSKEELFDALVTDVVRGNLEVAERIRDEEGPAPERLRRLVVDLMSSYAETYPLLYVYLQEDMAHVAPSRKAWADDMRKVNRRYEAAVTDIIAQGVAEGTIRDAGPPWLLAFGLMGMVSWTHRWFNPETSAVDASTVGEAYAAVLLDGLRADR